MKRKDFASFFKRRRGPHCGVRIPECQIPKLAEPGTIVCSSAVSAPALRKCSFRKRTKNAKARRGEAICVGYKARGEVNGTAKGNGT